MLDMLCAVAVCLQKQPMTGVVDRCPSNCSTAAGFKHHRQPLIYYLISSPSQMLLQLSAFFPSKINLHVVLYVYIKIEHVFFCTETGIFLCCTLILRIKWDTGCFGENTPQNLSTWNEEALQNCLI